MTRTIKQLLAMTALSASVLGGPGSALAQEKAEVTFQRFFGACEADYGDVTDLSQANGECGIITALVNKFNAESQTAQIDVSTVEWPGYDQLTAQFASGEPPHLVTMHAAVISDYALRGLLEPLDQCLANAGVDVNDFTAAAKAGVTKEGQVYGLPIDNHPWLWHINLNLFKQAGLVNADGTPILPKSPEEWIAQAEQFKERTGKPYLLFPVANEQAAFTRTLDTLLFQQNSDFFADPNKVKLNTPEAKGAVELLRRLYAEGHIIPDQDYAAQTASFLNGEGGVNIVGTWLIGDFHEASQEEGSALQNGYTVVPFPQLYAKHAVWGDSHTIVMPKTDASDEQRKAACEFLKFVYDNNFEWARTGHVPASQKVFDSAEFKALPHRDKLAALADIATPRPAEVKRQFAVQEIEGEEVGAAMTGQKEVDQALADAETRINELLANVE